MFFKSFVAGYGIAAVCYLLFSDNWKMFALCLAIAWIVSQIIKKD